MAYEYNLRIAVLTAVNLLSFEDRDDFVRSHRYDKENSNTFVLNTEGLKRTAALGRYYPHYTVDNLYEYCIFRNLITLLNQYAKLFKADGVTPSKRAFTLGHWKPLVKGGAHHRSNWFIQTFEENMKAGETVPVGEKWSLKEQVDYIMSKINFNFVDEKYLVEMHEYVNSLGKVY